MFDCRACAAKDGEIARLVHERQDLLDRFLALTGKLMDYHEAKQVAAEGPELEATQREVGDEEWQDRELVEAAERLERGGGLRRDFPVGT